MAYPQAPWGLRGYAIATLNLVDIERVRPLIPPEFDIIPVLPGKTVSGIYLSYYEPGSVLEYSELIVTAGLLRYSGQFGGWVSHIYVDNADSVAGGREIWGLPKELAEFEWNKGNRATSGYENSVVVRQGERELCHVNYNPLNFGLPLPSISGQVFSTLSGSILLFKSEFESRVGVVGARVQIPSESPFASLNLEQPWLTFYLERLRLVTGVPEVVGRREGVLSDR